METHIQKYKQEIRRKSQNFLGQFLEKYEEKFGSYPPYQFSAVLAYDLGYLLAQSIDETNSQNTRKIRDYLYQLESFNGLVASYSFDENGDATEIPHVLKKIENGEITTIRKVY